MMSRLVPSRGPSPEQLRYIKPGVGVYLRSRLDGARRRESFQSIERFCLFVGYPRSGHSLTGALMDAHPNMVISHELDALKFVKAGYSREQLYSLVLRRDQDFVRSGLSWSGYSYEVPGQWQGRYAELRVIGDKMGGMVAWQVHHDPDILDRLQSVVGKRIGIIHITRNPFDNIATMYKWRKQPDDPLREYVRRYFEIYCAGSARADAFAGPERCVTMRHEDIVAHPRERLRELCAFLGEEASAEYLEACAALIFPSAKKSRHSAPWTPAEVEAVERGMEPYPFLHGYTFDD